MSQSIVYIAFGGNIGDSRWIFREAKAALIKAIGPLIGTSRLYSSEPMVVPGAKRFDEQSAYLNAAAAFETVLTPPEVLSSCLTIEKIHGRDRSSTDRWASRTLDLDIIAFGEMVFESEMLAVPHPEFHKRDFVLYPLADINPYYLHPILQKTVSELIEDLQKGDTGYVTEVDSTPW